jgi:hypothetical protein
MMVQDEDAALLGALESELASIQSNLAPSTATPLMTAYYQLLGQLEALHARITEAQGNEGERAELQQEVARLQVRHITDHGPASEAQHSSSTAWQQWQMLDMHCTNSEWTV